MDRLTDQDELLLVFPVLFPTIGAQSARDNERVSLLAVRQGIRQIAETAANDEGRFLQPLTRLVSVIAIGGDREQGDRDPISSDVWIRNEAAPYNCVADIWHGFSFR